MLSFASHMEGRIQLREEAHEKTVDYLLIQPNRKCFSPKKMIRV